MSERKQQRPPCPALPRPPCGELARSSTRGPADPEVGSQERERFVPPTGAPDPAMDPHCSGSGCVLGNTQGNRGKMDQEPPGEVRIMKRCRVAF